MKEWVKVTKCPYCGGDLEVSSYYTFSRDYKILKTGKLSKKYKTSHPGPLNCITAYCYGCETTFEEGEISIEEDDSVYLLVDIEEDEDLE